jgi:hypothetical protein
MGNCKQHTTINLGRALPSCGCNCGCNAKSSSLEKPSGGNDGNVLAKNGNGLIWLDIPQNLPETIDNINESLNTQSSSIDTINNNIDTIEDNISNIEEDISTITSSLNFNNSVGF